MSGVTIKLENGEIAALYKGRTYVFADSASQMPGYGFYRYDLPRDLRDPDRINHIYLFFNNGEKVAIGVASTPEDSSFSFTGRQARVVKAFHKSELSIDEQVEDFLRQRIEVKFFK